MRLWLGLLLILFVSTLARTTLAASSFLVAADEDEILPMDQDEDSLSSLSLEDIAASSVDIPSQEEEDEEEEEDESSSFSHHLSLIDEDALLSSSSSIINEDEEEDEEEAQFFRSPPAFSGPLTAFLQEEMVKNASASSPAVAGVVDVSVFRKELQNVKENLIKRRKALLDKEKVVGAEMRKYQGKIAHEKEMIAAIKKRAQLQKEGKLEEAERKAAEDLYKLKPELRELDDGLKFVADLRGMVAKLGKLDPNSEEYKKVLDGVRKQLAHPAWKSVLDFEVTTELIALAKGCENVRKNAAEGNKKQQKTKKAAAEEQDPDKKLEDKYLADAKSDDEKNKGDLKKEYNSLVNATVTASESKAVQAAAKAGEALSGADQAGKAATRAAQNIEAAIQKEEIAGLTRILDRMETSINAKRVEILSTLKGDKAAVLRAKALGLSLEHLPAHQERLAAAEAALKKWQSESGKIHEDLTKAIAAYNAEIARLDAIIKRVDDYNTNGFVGSSSNSTATSETNVGVKASDCIWSNKTGQPQMSGFKQLRENVTATAVSFRFEDETDRGQILYGVYEDFEEVRSLDSEGVVPENFFEFLDLSLPPVSPDAAFTSDLAEESSIRFGPASNGGRIAAPAPSSSSSNVDEDGIPKDVAKWMWIQEDIQMTGGPIAPGGSKGPLNFGDFQKEYAANAPKSSAAQRAAAYQEYKKNFATATEAAKTAAPHAPPASGSAAAPKNNKPVDPTIPSDAQLTVGIKGDKVTFSNKKGQSFAADVSKGNFEVKTTTPGVKLGVSKQGSGYSLAVIKQNDGNKGAKTGSKVAVDVNAGQFGIDLKRKGAELGVNINTNKGQYQVNGKVGETGLAVKVDKKNQQYAFDLGLPGGNSAHADINKKDGSYAIGASVKGQEINFGLDKNSISVNGRVAGVGAQFYADKSGKVNLEVSQMVGVDKKTLGGLPADLNYKYGGRLGFDPKTQKVKVGGFLSGDARVTVGKIADVGGTGKVDVGVGIGKRSLALHTNGNAEVGVTVAGVRLANMKADLKGESKWAFVNGQLQYTADNKLTTKTTFLGREIQSAKISSGGKLVSSLDLASGTLNVATDGKAKIESRLFGKDVVTAKLNGKATLSVNSKGKLDINGTVGTKVSLFGGAAKMNGDMTIVTQENGKKIVNGSVGFNVGSTGLSASMKNNQLSATFSNKHLGSISYDHGKIKIETKSCKSKDCSVEFSTQSLKKVIAAPIARFSDRMLKPAGAVAKYMVKNGVKGVVDAAHRVKEAANYVTGKVSKLRNALTGDKNNKNNKNKNNKKAAPEVSKALTAARNRILKDSAALKTKFNSALQNLKNRVTKSPEFKSAKSVYDKAKQKVSSGYKALKNKLTQAASELQKRIKSSPVYKGAVKLAKQLQDRYGKATAKIAASYKKGSAEYKAAVNKLKSKIRDSELFKRGKKLATAVRTAWNTGKGRLVTAFKQSKDKVKNVVTKSKAFQAAVKFGQRTKAYVASASAKLRSAYSKARSSLNARLAAINKGVKAGSRSAAQAAALALAKKADKTLANFGSTVKSFDKAVKSMKGVGSKIFGDAKKAAAAVGGTAAKTVKDTLSKAKHMVKTGQKLADKAKKVLNGGNDKKSKSAADKKSSNSKDEKKKSSSDDNANNKNKDEKKKSSPLSPAKAKEAAKAVDGAKKAYKRAESLVKKASGSLGKIDDATAMARLKKGLQKMNKKIAKVKGIRAKSGSESAIAKRGGWKKPDNKKKGDKGTKGSSKGSNKKGGYSPSKKGGKGSSSSLNKSLLKLDKGLANMISRGGKAAQKALSRAAGNVSKGLNTLGKHVSRAVTSLGNGAIKSARSMLNKGLSHAQKLVHDTARLARKTTRGAARRVKEVAKRAAKAERNLVRRGAKAVNDLSKRARQAVRRSFKRLDEKIGGLRKSEQRHKTREEIRRESRKTQRGARRIEKDLERSSRRSAFDRMNKNARNFKNKLSRTMRRYSRDNMMSRKFAQMRRQIRRRFDGIKSRQQQNGLRRMVRRNFNAGKQARRDTRNLERNMRRQNEDARRRRMISREGRRLRRETNQSKSERRAMDRLGRRFRSSERKTIRQNRRMGQDLRRKWDRNARQQRERREMGGIRRLVRRDAQRNANARRARQLNNKIRRDFNRDRRTVRRSTAATDRKVKNFERQQQNRQRSQRLGKEISKDGRRITRATRREDKSVNNKLRRQQTNNSWANRIRQMEQNVARVANQVRSAARQTAQRIRTTARRTGNNLRRFAQNTGRAARRGSNAIVKQVRRATTRVNNRIRNAGRAQARVFSRIAPRFVRRRSGTSRSSGRR